MASRFSGAKGSENLQLFKNLFELGVKHAERLAIVEVWKYATMFGGTVNLSHDIDFSHYDRKIY